MRGETFGFSMADLTVFFREIQRDEYFDSILARLSMKNLEKVTIQFEDQMKEILIGEICDCWCHKVFLQGVMWRISQSVNATINQLWQICWIFYWSNKNDNFLFAKYYWRSWSWVLLLELIALLLVNIFTISKEEARQNMLDLDFFHTP